MEIFACGKNGDAVFRVRRGWKMCGTDEIEYICKSGRAAEVHLVDGTCFETVYLRTSFSVTFKALSDRPQFLFCGKVLIVSLSHIMSTDDEERTLIMRSGARVYPPFRQYSEAVRAWMSFR